MRANQTTPTGRSRPRYCKHGHDTHSTGRNTQGYCCTCSRVKQRAYTSRKLLVLHRYKMAAGCCKCGYDASGYALDLHHRDPSQKLFAVGRVLGISWERIWREIDKCDVLCRNCHAVLHVPRSHL